MLLLSHVLQKYPSLFLLDHASEYELRGSCSGLNYQLSENHTIVKAYAQNFFGWKYYLVNSKIDSHGNFNLHYKWNTSLFSDFHWITIRIFNRHYPLASKGLKSYRVETLLHEINFTIGNDRHIHEIGHQNVKTPLSSFQVSALKEPQSTILYQLKQQYLWVQASTTEVPKDWAVQNFQFIMTTRLVQILYNQLGPLHKHPNATLPHLLDDLLNGLCAVEYKQNDGCVEWCVNWDQCELLNPNALPNITIIATKEASHHFKLTIKSIAVQFKDEKEPRVIEKEHPLLPWAIYMARSTFALKFKIEHLAQCQLLPAMIAQSFLKTISTDNPLYSEMEPYFSRLGYKNWLKGSPIIFGKDGLIELSALSENSIAELIIQAMRQKAATMMNYNLVEPLESNHYLARAQQQHYSDCLKYFEDFIKKNHNNLKSKQNELYKWSQAMQVDLKELAPIMTSFGSYDFAEIKLAHFLANLVNQMTLIYGLGHKSHSLLAHVDQASLHIQNKGLNISGMFASFGNTDVNCANQQLKYVRTLLNYKIIPLNRVPVPNW